MGTGEEYLGIISYAPLLKTSDLQECIQREHAVLDETVDDRTKCMVEVNGKSIIERQISVMHNCGIKDEDITVVAGYRGAVQVVLGELSLVII